MARRTKAQRRQHKWITITRWVIKPCISQLEKHKYNKDFPLNANTNQRLLEALRALDTLRTALDDQFHNKT